MMESAGTYGLSLLKLGGSMVFEDSRSPFTNVVSVSQHVRTVLCSVSSTCNVCVCVCVGGGGGGNMEKFAELQHYFCLS